MFCRSFIQKSKSLEPLTLPHIVVIETTARPNSARDQKQRLSLWPCFRSPASIITWRGTWRLTCLNIPKTHQSQISCKNLFSDALHRPFLCAHSPLLPYVHDIPARNKIPCLSNLSTTEFSANWTNKPFILTEPVQEWPAYREWSIDDLLQKYGHINFRAESVDWPFKIYVDYMNENQDESPLYLFDRSFVEKMALKVGEAPDAQYSSPLCFGEDLFAALGSQRPDSRWLIVGPERSGSTFHKDPNATRFGKGLAYLILRLVDTHLVHGTLFFAVPNTGSCSPPPPLIRPLLEFSYPMIKAK